MPTYEYRCAEGHTFERFQKMSDPPVDKCPECGAAAERLMSAGAGLVFKGSGFYITDYRSEGYKKAAESDRTGTAGAAGGAGTGADATGAGGATSSGSSTDSSAKADAPAPKGDGGAAKSSGTPGTPPAGGGSSSGSKGGSSSKPSTD